MSKSIPIIIGFLILTLGFSALIVAPPSTEATELDGPGYALIAAPQFGLTSQVDEAEALRSYLLGHGWTDEMICFLADSTENYVDGDATKDNIEEALENIALNSNPSDIIFIAILDHGQDMEGTAYFRTGDEGSPVYISDTQFASWVDDIEDFTAMVLYISCPYSGGFVGELEGDGRIVISDCGVMEDYTISEYTFYEALIEEDADTDNDQKVSVEEAYTYMEDTMTEQHPVIYDYQEDVDLFL